MLKKIELITVIFFVTLAQCITPANKNANNKNNAAHIQTQTKAVLRSWQRTVAALKDAELSAPTMYAATEAAAKKLVFSPNVAQQVHAVANQEFKSITAQKKSYQAVDFLPTFFPETIAGKNPYLTIVYKAVANRELRLILWQKLNALLQSSLSATTKRM